MTNCWQWFLALNNTRSSGFGASPITYTEMWCYFNLNDIEVSQWELNVIRMFDSIALDTARKQEEKQKNNNKTK